MSKLWSIVAVLTVTTVAAHAQPALTPPVEQAPSHYVEAGVGLGGITPVAGVNTLVSVAGGNRLSEAMWLHGEVDLGNGVDDQGAGPNLAVRAGVEAHACLRRAGICAFGGADLGYLSSAWDQRGGATHEQLQALVVVPRGGLDVGGDQLRIRLGLDLDYAVAGRRTPMTTQAAVSQTVGAALGLRAAYLW